ncbi:MAG TPA: SMP-30/gluconolactonase/LRE family protein [Actinophytocola sp.]|jgi:sugar lactone lactonase YvrE|uniref:SMP-30/gluconolactonase/LRE family protein n=1 Tax=Actinophytocola sp. TaxID=1872138 RepID=UPI002F93A712
MNEIRTLLTGRGLLESPRWHDGRLYVSDWTAGEVLALDDDGGAEVVAKVAALPLCTAWAPDGRLLVVDAARGLLLRREPDGSLATHAELGRAGWNDIVVDGRGNAYIDSVGYDPATPGEVRPGAVHLVTPDGSVREVGGGIAFPNGMAVTPDNGTLIVADSHGHALVAFDIEADGGLANRRVWADLGVGTPDGICLDADGTVWYADVPNRCCARIAEGGAELARIELDRGGFACVLGGPHGTTLFAVAARWRGMTETEMVEPGSGQVVAIDVDVPGAGWP